ncbi:MAG TPA: PIG-L family deacetylase [Tepidisphaeraceae bacterium]
MKKVSRRDVLSQSLVASGTAVLGLPLAGLAADGEAAKLKVVVAGGHPDDPESGAGGTMARVADLGHEVVALYLTRGEAGIKGKSAGQAAAIRSAECEAACRVLKARAVFAGQVDGATEINAARYEAFAKVLMAEKPDLVLTHWPVDTHRDHRAASFLVYDAWLKAGRRFALYYFEVMTGTQSQLFRPTHYVDITSTEERKRAACFAHESQDPKGFYEIHDLMNRFRGREHGCKFAEGFVRHDQSRGIALP